MTRRSPSTALPVKRLDGEVDRAGDRRAACADRRAPRLAGEGLGVGRVVDDPHGTSVPPGPGPPFDIGDGDAAERAGCDGLDHVGMAERLDVAVALDGELVIVHGPRDVDGEDELGVDLDRLLGAREAGGEEGEGSEENWEAVET